jgi:uncharacterized membrane protein YhiD involved in acid resistance
VNIVQLQLASYLFDCIDDKVVTVMKSVLLAFVVAGVSLVGAGQASATQEEVNPSTTATSTSIESFLHQFVSGLSNTGSADTLSHLDRG